MLQPSNELQLQDFIDRIYHPVANRLRGHRDFNTSIQYSVEAGTDPEPWAIVYILYEKDGMGRWLSYRVLLDDIKSEEKMSKTVDRALITLIGWINKLYMN